MPAYEAGVQCRLGVQCLHMRLGFDAGWGFNTWERGWGSILGNEAGFQCRLGVQCLGMRLVFSAWE